MEAFRVLRSRLVPLPRENIDTDQIIPARFLKVTDKAGLGQALFADWRVDEAGRPRPDFPLNRPEFAGAKVLLAGGNFGCGSSREHAPWALLAHGFRAVISTSFADIFRNNALKNGLLPVVVDSETLQGLFAAVAADPTVEVQIDLERQVLRLPEGREVAFPLDPFSQRLLLEGKDELDDLLSLEGAIREYEATHPGWVRTV
ncbi:MAG: 3-isopropylmalate dehydratase small subunit [Anaerolineae bacterium]